MSTQQNLRNLCFATLTSCCLIAAPTSITIGLSTDTSQNTPNGGLYAAGNPLSAPGTVYFLNNNTYSGPTLITNGTLVVNGSSTSPTTVLNTGTLQGTGSINNTVRISSGGTIHAGNSIGTITLGNLALQRGANLQLEIAPQQDNSSKYVVNGSASLEGATLNVSLTESANLYPSSQTYTFLTSTAGIVGTFGAINTPPGFFAFVSYLNPRATVLHNILISSIGSLFTSVLADGGLSHNQKALLNYLIGHDRVAALQPILVNLAFMPIDQLKEALNSISPARNAAATYFTNQVAFRVGKISLDRLAEARMLSYMTSEGPKKIVTRAFSSKNENLMAMAESVPIPNAPADFAIVFEQSDNVDTKPAGKSSLAASKPNNFRFWATGFGDFLSQDRQNSNPKILDTASGAVLGLDYYGYQNGMFSLSAGYIHNNLTADCSLSGRSNGFVTSFYSTGMIGNGYIEGGLLGSYNRFSLERNIALAGPIPLCETAYSSFNNWMMMPHLGGGYDWLLDWGVVEPFGSLDWAISFQKGYTEKGATPLNARIRSQTPSILRTQLGINFYETWDSKKHLCIFQESASYINKAPFSTKMRSGIIIAPATAPAGVPTSFSLWTYDQILNLGGIGFELFYKHKPTGFFLSTSYQGEFGSSYMSNDITGTLGVFF